MVLNATHQLEGISIQDDRAKKLWEVLDARVLRGS
jgi:hypothetical protein